MIRTTLAAVVAPLLALAPAAFAQEYPAADAPAPVTPVAPVAPVAPDAPVAPAASAPDAPAAPAPGVPAPESAPLFGYKDAFFLGTPDGAFKLTVGGLLQPRFEAESTELTADTTKAAFQVRRAQVTLGGHVFDPRAVWSIRIEYGQGFTFLKDGFVNYKIAPRALELRVGQMKKAFSRIELTSDWRLTFIERSTMNGVFGSGRDLGVELHNDFGRSPPFEWCVQFMSGATDRPAVLGDVTLPAAGESVEGPLNLQKGRLSNVPGLLTPTLVARAGYNHGDLQGYTEYDVTGGDLRFGVAAAVQEAVDPGTGDAGATRAEIDAIVKVAGFDANAAVYTGLDQTSGDSIVQEYFGSGLHAQLGYMLGTHHFGLRGDAIVLAGAEPSEQYEVGVAHTALLHGLNVVWQTDVAGIVAATLEGDTTTWRARTQLQLAF